MTSPNVRPRNKFIANGETFEISATEHADKAVWQRRLALVSSLPTRYVGVVLDDPSPGKPFYIYAALQYHCEMRLQAMMQPVQDPMTGKPTIDPATGKPALVPVGFRGNTDIHALIPYDLFMTPSIQILNAEHIIWVAEQDEPVKNWFYSQYLQFFDPPKIERPSLIHKG
jgi:hypothetical protein